MRGRYGIRIRINCTGIQSYFSVIRSRDNEKKAMKKDSRNFFTADS